MPDLQPIPFLSTKEEWIDAKDELFRALNYVTKDIYEWIGSLQGVGTYTVSFVAHSHTSASEGGDYPWADFVATDVSWVQSTRLAFLFATPTFTFGSGAAGVDYALTVNGESNDGVLTWMEDEDYWKFSDDVLMDTTERVYFRDTAISIYSANDGYLDILADTAIRFSNNVQIGTGAAGVDYYIYFNGETYDGYISWMEDEYFFAVTRAVNVYNTDTANYAYIGFSEAANTNPCYIIRWGSTHALGYLLDIVNTESSVRFFASNIRISTMWYGTWAWLEVGQSDYLAGVVDICGHATGSTQGGFLALRCAADHDGTIDYYGIYPYEDDLYIGPSTDADALKLDSNKDFFITAGDIHVEGGGVYVSEVAAAQADIAAKGQFWVKNDTPNNPYFTNDAGTDLPLAPSGHVHFDVLLMAYTSVVGTWVTVAAASLVRAAYKYNSSTNDADEIVYTIYCGAGTYSLQLLHTKLASGGIVDVYIDGSEIGSVDTYNAATTSGAVTAFAGNVLAAGSHTIKFKLDGKNALSSDYGFVFYEFGLQRTA